MHSVYGKDCILYTQIFIWYGDCKDVKKDINNNPKSGCSKIAAIEENSLKKNVQNYLYYNI